MADNTPDMPNRVLPAEVCARIVRYAGEGDLPALCRTSKLLQEHAEPKLYQDIFLRDPRSTPRICSSLLIHEGKRASYVRRLWVCLETRLYPRGPLPEPFWKLVGDIFSKVDNLEFLFVTDPEACRSWLTDPTSVHFQLREASLQLLWDKQLVAFLHTQKRLRILVVSDIIDSQSDNNNIQQAHPIFPGSLPELVTFDGPLEVAIELLSCPLRHVHTQIEEQDGDVLLTYLSKVVHTSKTLRSFDAVIVPESLVCSTLSILANSPLAAHMRHIGVLALPLNEVSSSMAPRSFFADSFITGTAL